MTTNQQTTINKIRIIQAGTCDSLSGRTSIDFQVGCNADEQPVIRIVRTSGNGFYSKEWVRFEAITSLLVNPVTANSLRPIFQGKSVNTPGFLLAVAKHLGLVQPIPEAIRGYQVTESTAFFEHLKMLMKEGVEISDTPPPANKKLSIKPKKEKPKQQ